jgi:hypothetical protein
LLCICCVALSPIAVCGYVYNISRVWHYVLGAEPGTNYPLPPLLFPCVLGCSPGGPFPMSFLLHALCFVFLSSREVFPPSPMSSLCAGVVLCRVQHVRWGLSVVVTISPCGVAVESFISCGRCRLGCAELRRFGLYVFSCVCLWERFSRYIFLFVFHGVQ